MQKHTASVIIDGQAGSCGKGKLAAYLALRYSPSMVAATFGPNAGHTVVLPPWLSPSKEETRLVFQHLPAGSVCGSARIFVGAGSIIEPDLFEEEVCRIEAAGISIRDRLIVHPRAAVIEDVDIAYEKTNLTRIASTTKGVGSALARKLLRAETSRLAGHIQSLRRYTERWTGTDMLAQHVRSGGRVLVETSQGFDLDINHGIAYPYCTSRQISATQALADLALPPGALGDVFGIVRPYPIKVGNVVAQDRVVGFSGPYAEDSEELSWQDVATSAGMSDEQLARLLEQELTTVTKRLRRVFSFSDSRYRTFCSVVGPSCMTLAFADQLNVLSYGASTPGQLTQEVFEFVERLEIVGGVPVRFISTGPGVQEMVDLVSDRSEVGLHRG